MGELGVSYKSSFKIFIWLITVIKCFYCQDCKFPVTPVYGSLLVDGNNATYYCNKGYGLVGPSTRYCFRGRWQNSSPTCMKAATPLENGERTSIITDNNRKSCLDPGDYSRYNSDLLVFYFNRNFSKAIIRISVKTPYPEGYVRMTFNNGACGTSKRINSTESNLATYDFYCTLDTESSVIEVESARISASVLCEVEVLPYQNIACPLSGLSVVNGNIKYDPELMGETAPYGTAAVYRCNEKETLRGSKVRYCIEENRWSGNQTFCGAIPTENSNTALITIGVLVGLLLIFGLVAVVLSLQKKAKKKKNNKMSVEDCYQQTSVTLRDEEEVGEYAYISDTPCSIQTDVKNQLSQETEPMYMGDLIEVTNSVLLEEGGYLVPIKSHRPQETVDTCNIDQNDMNLDIYCSVDCQ